MPPKKYTNIITLNTAGSNLILFACPSPAALMSWAAALRLCAWEKARLEEIYTAHLLRITLPNAQRAPTPLVGGKLEGWVRVRVAGQTDWKRLWMCVTAGASDTSSVGSGQGGAPRKRRMSSIFSGGGGDSKATPTPPSRPTLWLYSGNRPKERKKPVLTLVNVRQAFAVYPERPELISRSTLVKIEGVLGDEEVAAAMKGHEGWILIMPELEGGNMQASEMLKWILGES
jgi:CCR4-NOT transcriptional complex subunit CAF120